MPTAAKVSEDMALSRLGILQDMRIEKEQVDLIHSYSWNGDLFGVLNVCCRDSSHSVAVLVYTIVALITIL